MRLIDADALIEHVWRDRLDSRELIAKMVENAPTIEKCKWILCSEQLPEKKKKYYWVCTNTGYQCQCRWTNNIFGIVDSDEWRWKIFDIPQYSNVVAWMPLPEPYQETGL